MKRDKEIKPEARYTADDEWQDKLRETCARAGAHWLRDAVNIRRPIASLTLTDMCGLAEAITSTWIVKVSQRPDHAAATKAEQDAYALLLGGV